MTCLQFIEESNEAIINLRNWKNVVEAVKNWKSRKCCSNLWSVQIDRVRDEYYIDLRYISSSFTKRIFNLKILITIFAFYPCYCNTFKTEIVLIIKSGHMGTTILQHWDIDIHTAFQAFLSVYQRGPVTIHRPDHWHWCHCVSSDRLGSYSHPRQHLLLRCDVRSLYPMAEIKPEVTIKSEDYINIW